MQLRSFIIALMFCVSSQAAYSMNKETKDDSFIMPSKQVLSQRLKQEGFEYFIEKTNILDQLAGQKKVALGVAMAVETSLYDFHQYINNPKISTVMQMRKGQLLETLLQDNPAAIEELCSLGLMQKK